MLNVMVSMKRFGFFFRKRVKALVYLKMASALDNHAKLDFEFVKEVVITIQRGFLNEFTRSSVR